LDYAFPHSADYGLSTNAIRRAALAAGVLTSEQAASLAERRP
jgi:hypothetical protein